MKKIFAFTLSEVLITLTIIGIVAAITLPVLNNELQDMEYKAALKKNYSVLQQAFALSYGYDYDDFRDWNFVHSTNFTKEVTDTLSKHLNIIKICGNEAGCFAQAKAKNGNYATYTTEKGLYDESYSFILNDGTAMALDVWNGENVKNVAGVSSNLILSNANLVIGVDVNGDKKPNIVGRDVYMFILTDKGIVPAGSSDNSKNCNNRKVNYNWDCTAKMLE